MAALKHNMHEDPTSKPAADVLLFNKATQLPVVNWTGPIKHKANGRVVEMCSLSLQVGLGVVSLLNWHCGIGLVAAGQQVVPTCHWLRQ